MDTCWDEEIQLFCTDWNAEELKDLKADTDSGFSSYISGLGITHLLVEAMSMLLLLPLDC